MKLPPRGPLLRLLASAVILAALFAYLPRAELRVALSTVPLWLWTACLAAFIAAHCVGAYKWHLLIDAHAAGNRYRETLRAYFAGLFANLFLPSVAGGDVVRAGVAMRSREAKQAVVFGSVLDRLIDTGVLLGFVLTGAAASHATLTRADAAIVAVTALAVCGAALAVAVLLAFPAPGWLPDRVVKVRGAMRAAAASTSASRITTAVALSCLVQGVFVFLNANLGAACGIDLDAGGWLFAWPLAKLAAMVPVSMGGIGVREAAFAALLARFGIAPAPAVAAGLVWETVLIAGAACGAVFYLSLRRGVAPGDAGVERA